MKVMEYATPGERRVATALVDYAKRRGWTISVYDGGEWVVEKSTNYPAVLKALASSDQDILRFGAEWGRIGYATLVWGNAEDGSELIGDHSDNLLMEQAWNYAMDHAHP